jgi:hypothetical protein
MARLAAEGASDVTDALGNIVIGDEDVRPQRLHDRITRQKSPRVLHHQQQKRERFGPERDSLALRGQQRLASWIQDKGAEPVNCMSRWESHFSSSPPAHAEEQYAIRRNFVQISPRFRDRSAVPCFSVAEEDPIEN